MARKAASKKVAAVPAEKPDNTDRIVRGFVRQFERDLPPEAADGMYGARESDRFASRRYDVPNGTYQVGGSDWAVTFKKKKFVQAVRKEHTDAFPKRPKKVKGPGAVA